MNERASAMPDARSITSFIALTGLATALPFLIHIQWLTGPIVNAVLVLMLFLVGRKAALLACFIPSLMALAGGLLPPVMAPVLPFIMLGNVVFVLVIDFAKDRFLWADSGYWAGVFAGSFLKFLLIYSSARFVLVGIFEKVLPSKILEFLSWPQLYTALIGGAIAWLILKRIRRI